MIDPFALPLSDTVRLLTNRGIEPDFLLPTADNGFSVEFRQDGVYYLVEFLPTGEVALLKKQGKQIDTWDLTVDNYLYILQTQLV